MKQYIKDGQIKTRNQIVIKGHRIIKDKDGNDKVINTNTFNPTEEMILADGWVEYTTPVYEPTIEDYRRNKIREITRFDSSPEVNIFYIGEQDMWLDKATRVGLKLRFETEMEDGDTETTLWYEGIPFILNLTTANKMLHAIEKYASKCYDNTQRHIGNVNKLTTIEEIEAYDYKIGYPEKLVFDVWQQEK